jgi:hypothetical protein
MYKNKYVLIICDQANTAKGTTLRDTLEYLTAV